MRNIIVGIDLEANAFSWLCISRYKESFGLFTFPHILLKDMLSHNQDERCYTIRKDGSKFRIVVTPPAHRRGKQKVINQRGYLTLRSAEEDAKRLKEHLATKRLETFVKNLGIEMNSTTPISKKRGRTDQSIVESYSSKKVMSGKCLKQLLTRFQFGYHHYKMEAVEYDIPVLSKKVWTKLQSSAVLTLYADQGELERRAHLDTTLNYLHQRLQLLGKREQSYKILIKDIIKCIFTGTCYNKLRQVEVDAEEDDIIDLTDEPAFTQESTSKAQLTRVTLQCFVVYSMMQRIHSKNEKESRMLNDVLKSITLHGGDKSKRDIVTSIMTEHEIAKKNFRLEHSMVLIAEEVRLLAGGHISAKTIRMWYHEYIDNKSFKEDSRGTHDRVTFLEQYGYSMRFKIYLRNVRKLTVEVAARELELIISKNPPVTDEGKKAFESLRPFSRRTVHRWMLKLGCKYEKATVSYYTDSHEAEETKRDFKERCVFRSTLCALRMLSAHL